MKPMKSIFSKLPNDIINYILVFNERFTPFNISNAYLKVGVF